MLSVIMRNVVKLNVVALKYRLQHVQKSCDWLKVNLHCVFLNCDLTAILCLRHQPYKARSFHCKEITNVLNKTIHFILATETKHF
jgi:hypothetical protein